MAGEIVKFGDWISEGWKLFTLQWQTWVVASIFHLVIVIIPVIFLVIGVYIPILTNHKPDLVALVPLIFVLPLMIAGTAFIGGGMHRMAQKQLHGETISVRDIFSCGDCFSRLLGASFLVGLAVFCGLFVFFFGAYVAAALFFFTVPIIVNEDIGTIEAMRKSYDLVKRDLLMFTLFVFVVGLISQIGAQLCWVGLLATYPLLFTITAVAYRDCFGIDGAHAVLLVDDQVNTPYIYSAPLSAAEMIGPFNSSCPNCHTFMPATAAYCPKCGLERLL